MNKINPEQAKKELETRARKIKEIDLKKILNKRKSIENKLRENKTISKYIDKAKLMFSLIQDYRKGVYTQIPWKTIAAVAGALLYVLTPLDLIPDFIPVVGLLDDAGVLAACLRLVGDDLEIYGKWKAAHSGDPAAGKDNLAPE